MSLLSNADDGLVVTEGLTVTYSRSVVRGSWSWTAANLSGAYDKMVELHRYARKAFKYVGLTYSAAKSKRDSLVTTLTRDFSYSDWDVTVTNGQWDVKSGGTRLMSDISLSHTEGDSWEVCVSVNEDDVRMIKVGESSSFETRFAAENARDYATGGEGD